MEEGSFDESGDGFPLQAYRLRQADETGAIPITPDPDDPFPAPDLAAVSAALLGDETGLARASAKEGLVVAGIEVFGEVFRTLDPALDFTPRKRDGEKAERGELLAEISGSLASILTAERVALNLLQRMSGIATKTRRVVDACKAVNPKIKVAATRKTTPGFRPFEKRAVVLGGGVPHRSGLHDMFLVKDNHVRLAGSAAEPLSKPDAEELEKLSPFRDFIDSLDLEDFDKRKS